MCTVTGGLLRGEPLEEAVLHAQPFYNFTLPVITYTTLGVASAGVAEFAPLIGIGGLVGENVYVGRQIATGNTITVDGLVFSWGGGTAFGGLASAAPRTAWAVGATIQGYTGYEEAKLWWDSSGLSDQQLRERNVDSFLWVVQGGFLAGSFKSTFFPESAAGEAPALNPAVQTEGTGKWAVQTDNGMAFVDPVPGYRLATGSLSAAGVTPEGFARIVGADGEFQFLRLSDRAIFPSQEAATASLNSSTAVGLTNGNNAGTPATYLDLMQVIGDSSLVDRSLVTRYNVGPIANDGQQAEAFGRQALSDATGLDFRAIQNASNHRADGVAIDTPNMVLWGLEVKSSIGGKFPELTADQISSSMRAWIDNAAAGTLNGQQLDAGTQAFALQSLDLIQQGYTLRPLYMQVDVPQPGTTSWLTGRLINLNK
jgi:hypothetical protein